MIRISTVLHTLCLSCIVVTWHLVAPIRAKILLLLADYQTPATATTLRMLRRLSNRSRSELFAQFITPSAGVRLTCFEYMIFYSRQYSSNRISIAECIFKVEPITWLHVSSIMLCIYTVQLFYT